MILFEWFKCVPVSIMQTARTCSTTIIAGFALKTTVKKFNASWLIAKNRDDRIKGENGFVCQ